MSVHSSPRDREDWEPCPSFSPVIARSSRTGSVSTTTSRSRSSAARAAGSPTPRVAATSTSSPASSPTCSATTCPKCVTRSSGRSPAGPCTAPCGPHPRRGADGRLAAYASLNDADYIKACVDDLGALLSGAIPPADVACLRAEPVQGVGGFTMPPDGLLAAYKEVLDEHGILLISDEVQTGWGRTGEHFWGIGAHGVTPDAMTFAKGLGNGFAIGGVVARGDLLDGIRGNGISTFGGNPVATAAGNATLDYVLSHDLQRNAKVTGDLIISGLREAAQSLDVGGAVPGKGLMFAVDLVDPATKRPSP